MTDIVFQSTTEQTPLEPMSGFTETESFRFMFQELPVSRFAQCAMLAVMLLHSICGCCWHHAHEGDCGAGATGTHTTTAPSSPAGHFHTFCHHHHSRNGEQPGSPHPEHSPVHHSQCQQGQCVFVAAESVSLPPQLTCFATSESLHELAVIRPLKWSICRIQEHRAVPLSAGSRCAFLQVWII